MYGSLITITRDIIMKTINKTSAFIGPMLPKVKAPRVIKPKYLSTLDSAQFWDATVLTKDEVTTVLTTEIEELEAKLLLLKNQKELIVGKPSTYKAPKNIGVGAFIRQCITSGLRNVDILKLVEEQYANNNTTYACVAWYRNDMKKKSLIA